MKCPNCDEDMIVGKLAYINAKGKLFWAPEEYYKNKIGNFYTQSDIKKKGGVVLSFGNGITQDRTKGYVCKNAIVYLCNIINKFLFI